MAFPFTAGFYSKDLLLELLIMPNNLTHTIAYLLTLIAAILTGIYSIRSFIIVFISRPNYSKIIKNNIKDSNIYMSGSLIILSLGAIFGGYFLNTLILYNDLFVLPNHYIKNNIFYISMNNLIPIFIFALFICCIIIYPLFKIIK